MAINWSKIGAIMKRMGQPETIERNVPDDVTTDKVLRSLRRQRRVQLEELEKEKLKKEIVKFQGERAKRWVVDERPLLREGVKHAPPRRVRQSYLGGTRL